MSCQHGPLAVAASFWLLLGGVVFWGMLLTFLAFNWKTVKWAMTRDAHSSGTYYERRMDCEASRSLRWFLILVFTMLSLEFLVVAIVNVACHG